MQSLKWKIDSNCSAIQLESSYFDIEEGDFLKIGDQKYSGSPVIDQIIVGSSFIATFRSDGNVTATGFIVFWSCYLGSFQTQYGMNLKL